MKVVEGMSKLSVPAAAVLAYLPVMKGLDKL